MNKRVKQKITRTLFFSALSIVLLLAVHTKGKAQVRNITLYNGDEAEEWDPDYDQYYDDDDGIEYRESELFFPGDMGSLTLQYNWFGGELARKEYTSGNPAVVQVDSQGNYRILKDGTAVVYAKGWDAQGKLVFEAEKSFIAGGDVSQTTLKTTSERAYLFEQDYDNYDTGEISFPLLNAPDLTYCSFEPVNSSNSDMGIKYYLDKENKAIVISASEKGSTTLAFRLNRKNFTISLKVTKVSINKSSALLSTKKKVRLKLKGYAEKVKWVSSNKRVASVSKKGLIKAKRKGNTLIYAQIGDHRMGCVLSVVTPKMMKVIRHGKKIAKTCKYSQAKRMSAGYYDCSSLVWRSYHKIGKNLGDSNYAPVAANMAKWCKKKKKMVKGGVSEKNIAKMKLRPGDLVFMTGGNNGRYKGIYHVEMFAGYECYGFQGKKPILSPCWVNRYSGYGYGCKLVGRP